MAEVGIDIRTYENQNNAYDDLAIGRLEAVLMDWPIAVYYSSPHPGLKFAGPVIGAIEYGIGVRPDDPALLAQVNAGLLELMRSGELQRIYEKWGIWNSETGQLFARLTSAGAKSTALAEYAGLVTQKLTWRDRLRRYATYLRPMLLQGVPMTLLISLLGMALAMALGLLIALLNLYASRPLTWLARLYVELFRGTPLLIQLYLIFYGLPNIGIRLTPLAAAVIGLGLNYAELSCWNSCHSARPDGGRTLAWADAPSGPPPHHRSAGGPACHSTGHQRFHRPLQGLIDRLCHHHGRADEGLWPARLDLL